ncbi:hypothetical protein [Flavobacterium hercynium]|uniref:Uncharacterized protein n=1 Tax=Flavobacterium hercynium TaxID=387094 RepID=A0A226H7G1_9FLAO|nr:hypothetical protein [Flavobacterium hercynium]OXA90024.1 hypothetical protein B0A66_13550 [Flavobacterium hercynium]SMP14440.1 hypothetical protein SAMN06265346_10494 [Flavobacterium hercynium]
MENIESNTLISTENNTVNDTKNSVNEKNGVANPFYAVEVGSVIRGDIGRFQASIIKGAITRMIPDKEVKQTMTGSSSYAYTDSLNQGSVGVSGSYGISGLANINAGLSVYAGNSVAKLTKKVAVNYNVQMLSGVEYINLNDLNTADLINSLQANPKQMALRALDNYNQLIKKIGKTDLLTIMQNPKDNPEVIEMVEEWVKSVQLFFRDHGDGIVLGVVWGGMGTVSLEMISKSGESSWKYGTKGNFTYSGVGKAITVEAAYDGSNAKRESEVDVSTTSYSSGGCVADQVKKWSEIVEGKAFNDISSISLLEKAPQLSAVKDPPKVPEFKTPAKDSKVTDKIKEISDLSGLEAFAKAAAYEKAKQTEKDLTLDEFLRRAAEKANPKQVNDLKDKVNANDLDVEPNKVIQSIANHSISFKTIGLPENSIAEEPTLEKKDDNYTVLGVWISNWSDLFPWMATGYLNAIDDVSSTQAIIKKQCMIQDFLTLGKTYFMLDASGISHNDFNMDSFTQIAVSFSKQAGYIRDNFDAENVIKNAFDELSIEAQKIYTKWNDIKFLRSAELGLGIMYEGKKSVTGTVIKTEHSTYTKVWYKTDNCSFLPKNYSAFSDFLKVIPFITPNGDVYAFGPSQMLLNQINDDGAIFSKNPLIAAKLTVDKEKRVLKKGDVILYPIRFDAAKDIPSSWVGQSISTNVGAIKNINQHLDNAIKAMKDLNVYSFSSSNWKPDWKPEDYYSFSAIKKQYIGIVEELHNVF